MPPLDDTPFLDDTARPECAEAASWTSPDRPTGVSVRPAADDELDAAGEVVAEAYRLDDFASEDYRSTLSDARLRAREAEVLVAVGEDGELLGCVTFAPYGSRWAEVSGPGDAEFRMLGVAAHARGRGIGELLVRWCLERAREVGAERLVLSTETRMLTAHRLYRRLGFRRRPDLDWSPVPGIDLLGYSVDVS